MRPIKSYTYYNLMRVVRMIEAKGYDFDESVKTAKRIFESWNPNSLSILSMVDMIIPAGQED